MKTGCHSKGFLSVDCIHSQQRSLWESSKATWLRWKKVTVTYVHLLYEDRLPLQRVLVSRLYTFPTEISLRVFKGTLTFTYSMKTGCHSKGFLSIDCIHSQQRSLWESLKATWLRRKKLRSLTFTYSMKTGCHSNGFLSIDCVHSQQRSLWESLKATWLRWKKVTVTYVHLLYEDRLPLQRVLVTRLYTFPTEISLRVFKGNLASVKKKLRSLTFTYSMKTGCHSKGLLSVDCIHSQQRSLWESLKATWLRWKKVTVTCVHLL